MNYKELVRELAQVRKDLRICSRALSDRIGVAESSVSLWECGKKIPNAQLLLDWCVALGTTLTILHGKTTISMKYQPCQYTKDWITKTYGEHYDYNQEREIFIDYYKSTGAIKSDWHASFRNWLRRAHKFANARKNTESNLVVSTEGIQERRARISNVTNLRLKTQTKD